jgi:hypothetical protein
MENEDQRRRQADDERFRSRSGYEDEAGGEAWRSEARESHRPRRAERGWLDYERDEDRHYAGSDPRGRDDHRYGQDRYAEGRGEQRSRFSPDWTRQGEEPRYSDEPYYSRNRERQGGSFEDYSRRGLSGRRPGEDRGGWDQRARASIPREQHELAQRGEPGDYYDPNWPYERRDRGREIERSREDEQQRHYRGVYRQSSAPFSYPGGSGYLYAESWTLHGPYTGRGPRGYRRSDQQIIEEACQRLERDGEIDASDIEVAAENGVIRVRGTVQDRKTKRRAEECVESIYGVSDVMNELRVARQSGSEADAGQGWRESESGQSSQGLQAGQGAQGAPLGRGAQSPGSQPAAAPSATGTQSPGSQTAAHGSPPAQGSRPVAGSQGGEDDRKSPRH